MGKFIPVEPEKWAEMVKAMAENARLKAEVEELTGLLKASTYYNTSDEVTRLKAKVERLTKAGYAMAIKINVHGINDRFTDSQKLVDDWSNAAKKGGQP